MSTVDPRSMGDRMWEQASRFGRRAEIVSVDRLTHTGTVKIRGRVTDDRPFEYTPGQFIAIQEDVPGVGLQHSPYCMFLPPTDDRTFEMLIRVFPEGPLSHYLSSMAPGTPLHFRGPSGRSMLPKDEDSELVMLATGVGISPLHSVIGHLAEVGDPRPVRLYWGLRLVEDICLTEELDILVEAHPDFSYAISLSQPPPEWEGLKGRVTESVPPLLETLGGKRFYLSGNGAMCEEMEIALSDMGVDRAFIRQERFFNVHHRADQAVIDAILARFVARDLFSPYLEQQAPLLFAIERDVHGRKIGP
ncbi:MAG TPA: FAD-binding oxidoreductase [Acidimicrobiales bacterium]|nr:FAD-binding oxidoreductase [Acidimicrobiales bacterium]